MIVPAMNSQELLKEVFNDLIIVDRKANYLCQGLRRAAIKSKSKHVQQVFDYRSKQYNNWIIIVDCFVAMATFRTVAWYLDDSGMNGLRVNADLKSLSHLTPHFLYRYNERFLHQLTLSKLDLLKQFTLDNPLEVISTVSNGDTNGNRIFGRFNDGIGLGDGEVISEADQEIRHFRTFISHNLIRESQEDLNSYLGIHYDKCWDEVHNINYRRA